jgi:hypothetical protein
LALKSLIALALALTAACGSPSSQAHSEQTPSLTASLSPVEVLQRSDNLRLSIRLDPETVSVGQTPVVVTRFENVGSTALYVNPHLVTGGFLPDLDEPVRCVTNADYGIRVLTAKDFVRVPPGGAWEQRTAPGDRMGGGPFTRNAVPGTHRAGARYMNYPDCRHVRYDPTRIGIPVWEGRLDAPTVSLTIRPLPSPAEKALIARVQGSAGSDEDFALIAAQNSPATNAAVIEYLSRQPDNLWRVSRWIRDRSDCRAWKAISPAIGSSGSDMLQPLLTDTLLALGARCPTMLDDLRQWLADPGESQETREQSAILLGTFRQRRDVPLLISADEAVRRNATLVLELITFKTWQPQNGTQELRPADFDGWWEANRRKSRRDWAMDALGRPSTASPSPWWPPRHEKIRALEYLDARRDPALARTFRALTRDPDWSVRIKAAEALGRFDRQNAAGLLAREFDNRVLSACMAANDALRRLTGEDLQVDCEAPEARAAATARWLSLANRRSRG